MDLNGALEPMMKELRQTLSSINGTKGIQENLTIEYIVEVDTESEKEGVQKVGDVLSSQAERFGFSLEVVPVTADELAEAESLYAKYLAEQTQFKA